MSSIKNFFYLEVSATKGWHWILPIQASHGTFSSYEITPDQPYPRSLRRETIYICKYRLTWDILCTQTYDENIQMKSLDEKCYPHVLLYKSKHLNTIRSPTKCFQLTQNMNTYVRKKLRSPRFLFNQEPLQQMLQWLYNTTWVKMECFRVAYEIPNF